jgi:putative ABC transport system permease protein
MKLGKILGFFTILSILIGSLGVFGMAAFTTDQRSKEIGIRKAMGASVRSIIVLLSKDYIKLVLLSFIIGFPLAWYANHLWLQEFVYRIDNAWWIQGLSGLMVLLIAYIAIGYQSMRASLANPVDSLKTG